jgi:hypothetical protein
VIGDTGTEQIEWERERGNSGDLNRKNTLTPVDERADGDTDSAGSVWLLKQRRTGVLHVLLGKKNIG